MSIFSSLEAALMGKSGGQAEQGDDRLEGLEVASIDPYDQGAVKRTLDDGIVDVSAALGLLAPGKRAYAPARNPRLPPSPVRVRLSRRSLSASVGWQRTIP